jgi:hypothetical protein
MQTGEPLSQIQMQRASLFQTINLAFPASRMRARDWESAKEAWLWSSGKLSHFESSR